MTSIVPNPRDIQLEGGSEFVTKFETEYEKPQDQAQLAAATLIQSSTVASSDATGPTL